VINSDQGIVGYSAMEPDWSSEGGITEMIDETGSERSRSFRNSTCSCLLLLLDWRIPWKIGVRFDWNCRCWHSLLACVANIISVRGDMKAEYQEALPSEPPSLKQRAFFIASRVALQSVPMQGA
jgi:hypothetical protein